LGRPRRKGGYNNFPENLAESPIIIDEIEAAASGGARTK
jgi:hypothetical protein